MSLLMKESYKTACLKMAQLYLNIARKELILYGQEADTWRPTKIAGLDELQDEIAGVIKIHESEMDRIRADVKKQEATLKHSAPLRIKLKARVKVKS